VSPSITSILSHNGLAPTWSLLGIQRLVARRRGSASPDAMIHLGPGGTQLGYGVTQAAALRSPVKDLDATCDSDPIFSMGSAREGSSRHSSWSGFGSWRARR
jgi:hypothetical protein